MRVIHPHNWLIHKHTQIRMYQWHKRHKRAVIPIGQGWVARPWSHTWCQQGCCSYEGAVKEPVPNLLLRNLLLLLLLRWCRSAAGGRLKERSTEWCGRALWAVCSRCQALATLTHMAHAASGSLAAHDVEGGVSISIDCDATIVIFAVFYCYCHSRAQHT